MNWFNKWLDERLSKRDRAFMEATAQNAATKALHYYTCVRTLDDWRYIIEQADKSGEKYLSMADLVARSGFIGGSKR